MTIDGFPVRLACKNVFVWTPVHPRTSSGTSRGPQPRIQGGGACKINEKSRFFIKKSSKMLDFSLILHGHTDSGWRSAGGPVEVWRASGCPHKNIFASQMDRKTINCHQKLSQNPLGTFPGSLEVSDPAQLPYES